MCTQVTVSDEVASSEKLNLYDASYLSAALDAKHELVMNEKHLYNAAKKQLKVLKSNNVS